MDYGPTGRRDSLIFTVWYFFTKCFGLRALDEHRKMTLGDITLHKTVDGSEYIQFGERNSKMRDGTYRDDSRATAPKIFATGGDRDPVKFYKSYINHRPADSMTPDCPFFLTVNSVRYQRSTISRRVRKSHGPG